jgi:hypothetical protein
VKVAGRRGRLRLRLDRSEMALMTSLLDDLDAVLGGDPAEPDDVLQRLYPAAYRDDDEAETEFRTLTEAGLRNDRTERIEACRADLATGADIDLQDPETGQRWLRVLNDLRLTAGIRLGITEDDRPDFDPFDPGQQPRVVYYWLTAVQDTLVQALMR